SGPGSLRQALLYSNASAGVLDTVTFAIPTSDPGYHSATHSFTIQPLSPLPAVTDRVVIDGTNPLDGSGTPTIELDGDLWPAPADDYTCPAGGSTIKGLITNRVGGTGIELDAGGNLVIGNLIGTDATASLALGNGGDGVRIANGSANTVGGTADGAANL